VRTVVALGPDGRSEAHDVGDALPPDEPVRPRKYVPRVLITLLLWCVSVAMAESILEPVACDNDWSPHVWVAFALVWIATGLCLWFAWLALSRRE